MPFKKVYFFVACFKIIKNNQKFNTKIQKNHTKMQKIMYFRTFFIFKYKKTIKINEL